MIEYIKHYTTQDEQQKFIALSSYTEPYVGSIENSDAVTYNIDEPSKFYDRNGDITYDFSSTTISDVFAKANKGLAYRPKRYIYGLTKLQKAELSKKVRIIWNYAFGDKIYLYNLKSVQLIRFYLKQHNHNSPFNSLTADNVVIVGIGSCQHSSLISVNLPHVTNIKQNAFAYCFKLSGVTMPVVENINSCSFAACISLNTLTLPKTLKYIGKEAFSYCETLKDIYFEGTSEEWGW